MTRPKPDFTIEELIQEAIQHIPIGEENSFTPAELEQVFGVRRDGIFRRLDFLESVGWQIIPRRKAIIDRSGRHTSTTAYKLIPPNEKTPK